MPLVCAFALPDDPALDAFDADEAEVTAYFRSRRWFDVGRGRSAPPTYVFKTGPEGEVVGYAAVSFRRVPHPCDGSAASARYLVVYVLGVDRALHGCVPDGSATTYAGLMLERLDDLARGDPTCVGLYLWVRTSNARALRFYAKHGFVADPSGAMQRDKGPPHLSLRRWWQGGRT